ncbi:hypothetical protein SDRG_12657 [Saprolegnia diclina VS20]|uniref:Peptidase n=1 Tax=Saprolegnia diclina (strain VS20) TaxID=1156394 RepID=T0RBS8_SAPDV|nr:hypothetical protein SDRG_12657 [Saprolegnia diclina VS20]EQC29653.1 hypothetical protein SDRG_12657 [Saprolegnia diclina VS20]|eukprot:XP_008616957.1 hypothetical protein SDRG_12657 [Saprolegnia diclina VS20]
MLRALPLLLLAGAAVDACTVIAVTKGASADGASLTAHTDDTGGGAVDLRVAHVPAKDHAPNATRPVYDYTAGYPRLVTHERGPHYAPAEGQTPMVPLGFIPQVAHTYAYFDQVYGLMNEAQLSIAESTCSARTVGWPASKPFGYNLFSIAELSKLALERCDSARCAIHTMGNAAVQYGFYSTDSGEPSAPGYDDSSETLVIADKYGETWVFHVLTGPQNASAVWAAQRVPDGHVTAVANFFTIRTLNLSDSDSFLASSNVESFAQEMGWWHPADGPFDFTKAYAQPVEGPVVPLYGGRRIWRIFDTFAPSLGLDSTLGSLPETPTYPFSVKPDAPVSLNDVMELLKDHYEGTPYDMTKGVAAGPFGSPLRYDSPAHGVSGGWERSISMHRTLYSFVHQVFPDAASRGFIWYGQGAPHGTVYLPFSSAQTTVPTPYLLGTQSRFDAGSLWWVHAFVNNWCALRYDVMNADVRRVAKSLQESLMATAPTIDARAFATWHQNAADNLLREWWALAWRLVSTYTDGYATTGEGPDEMRAIGYPAWWLQASEYRAWPGQSFQPPPTQLDATSSVLSSMTMGVLYGGVGLVLGMALMYRLQTKRRLHYMQLD